jgi:hypothetical protein
MKRWLEIYNIHYPSNKKYYNDIRRWAFNKDFGVSDTQFFDFLKMCWEGYEDLEPLESQIGKYTSRIRNEGHILDIVTSVLPTHIKYTEKWLELHQISYDMVVHSDDKLNLSYDMYVDDRPDLFIEMDKKHGNKIGLMYAQPWNSWEHLNCGIHRLNNWSEITDFICKRDWKEL